MKTTIGAIRSNITTLESELNRLYRIANNSLQVNKIRELNGTETVISQPNRNYKDVMDDIHEHSAEIARLKGIVSRLNATTKLSSGQTLQEVICILSNLRREASSLMSAANMSERISRRSDNGLSSAPAYYDIVTPNFDVTWAEQRYKEITEQITTYENEIIIVNAMEIEVEDL